MGALHAGHLTLVEEARRNGDLVVVSIFVNPLQFNVRDDFDKYPRPIDDDVEACRTAGVDAVYAPTATTMYPAGFQTHVEPGALADSLEGASRPGHFRGVTTVVAKLFGAVEPDVAIFGQKDFQQLAIIRRMVVDLDMGVTIVDVPTVREPDGLAISSRNQRLTALDRRAAVCLIEALRIVADAVAAGEHDAARLESLGRDRIAAEPRADLEYLCIVDPETLVSIAVAEKPAVVLIAARFGEIRLIDNLLLTP
jgi:pantoate--beta-alanine ligase